MTDTNRRSADEILRALTELLIEHHKQNSEGHESAEDRELADESQHQQVLLPLQPAGINGVTCDGDPALPVGMAEHAGVVPVPWAQYVDANPTKKRSTSLILSPTLHAKMLWVVNNVPKISQQKLIQAGAEAEADRLIALYHKPT